jgi:toxin FitB
VIILDTNVVSEVMRSPSRGPVAEWLEKFPIDFLCTTAITVAEILHGIRLHPEGRRRSALAADFHAFMDRGFHGNVLTFDGVAADAYAQIMVARKRRGRPIAEFDAMIAGIAVAHEAQVATRDIDDFEGCGVEVLNPWV